MIRSDNPEPEITPANGLITGRLRAGMDGPPHPRNLQTEAADEIERLTARENYLISKGHDLAETITEQRPEIERLRDGLKAAAHDLNEGVAPEEIRARILDVLNWEIIQCRNYR